MLPVMSSLLRDMGILAALIVVGLLWSTYRVVTRRSHRDKVKAERQQVAREQDEAQPIPGLAAYAASAGWTGPRTDPPPDSGTQDFIREMARTFAGEATVLLHDNFIVGDIRYVNVFTGVVDGRRIRLGNTFTNLRPSAPTYTGPGTEHPTSFVAVDLPSTLPPLLVALRGLPPYIRPLVKEWTFESEDFNRRFLVMALDRKYASDVVTPRLMEMLLTRDDWVFLLEMSTLVCVCRTPFADVDEVTQRVRDVSRFAELIPAFVAEDRGLAMPTLPDGTVFDPRDPASLERMKAALATMTPEEQKAFVAKIQHAGAKWVLGAFGKDLPPEG